MTKIALSAGRTMEYHTFKVTNKVQETPSVVTLSIAPRDNAAKPFIPGQYLNIQLPGVSEVKSYTIASAPSAEYAISIRVAGNFSRRLAALKIGDTLSVTDPRGFFYPEDSKPRVFIAGGIGITPFMSMLRAMKSGAIVPTSVLYSDRTQSDMPFRDELDEYVNADVCSLKYFITREQKVGTQNGRISTIDLAHVSEQIPEANFFICGSIAFVRDMRAHLKSLSVAEEHIYTEAFF